MGAAHAGLYDGKALLVWIDGHERAMAGSQDEQERLDGMVWHGYVSAVIDVGVDQKILCAPSKIDITHIRTVVRKYLNEHPKELGDSADKLILRSLLPVFPCP